MIRKLHQLLRTYGINFKQMYNGLKYTPMLIKHYLKFNSLDKTKDFKIKSFFPCLNDINSEGGTTQTHYFHQDLYFASKIYKNNPRHHYDIGSRIDGFIAHLASFRKVNVFDLRNITSKINNINFLQLDLMNSIPESYLCKAESLSCLHTIEHFGLGRYGDKIDPNGHLLGLENLKNILKKNGIFYFSTPIGEQRIEFNAHRVFSMSYLLNYFEKDFSLLEFSFVDDNGDFFENVEINKTKIKNNFGCSYGCGMFILKKNE